MEKRRNNLINDAEQTDLILQMLFQWYCDGKRIRLADIMNVTELSEGEVPYYIEQIIQQGYIKEIKDAEEIELTNYGKAKGAENIYRHRQLTQFLQLIGLDEEESELDASHMEHVMSGKAIQGICNFLNTGDTFVRVVEDANLNYLYDEGEYIFFMSIYQLEKRYPQILAEEFYNFSDNVLLTVCSDKSSFWMQPADDKFSGDIWYLRKAVWEKSEYSERGYQIPTDVFRFSFHADDPITEGEAMIAFTGKDVVPREKDCRELRVHIW